MRADGSKSKYVQYDFPAVSLSAQVVPSPGGGGEHTYSKSALVTRATEFVRDSGDAFSSRKSRPHPELYPNSPLSEGSSLKLAGSLSRAHAGHCSAGSRTMYGGRKK